MYKELLQEIINILINENTYSNSLILESGEIEIPYDYDRIVNYKADSYYEPSRVEFFKKAQKTRSRYNDLFDQLSANFGIYTLSKDKSEMAKEVEGTIKILSDLKPKLLNDLLLDYAESAYYSADILSTGLKSIEEITPHSEILQTEESSQLDFEIPEPENYDIKIWALLVEDVTICFPALKLILLIKVLYLLKDKHIKISSDATLLTAETNRNQLTNFQICVLIKLLQDNSQFPKKNSAISDNDYYQQLSAFTGYSSDNIKKQLAKSTELINFPDKITKGQIPSKINDLEKIEPFVKSLADNSHILAELSRIKTILLKNK